MLVNRKGFSVKAAWKSRAYGLLTQSAIQAISGNKQAGIAAHGAMVNSYKTLLADGSIAVTGRPQSANSRNRIDVGTTNIKVYSNNLYDGGDILAGEAAAPAAAAALPPSPPKLAASNSQKFQQQRAMAAQKRLERLQLGGMAQTNDSIAVVTVNNSRPSTPGSTKPPPAAAGLASSSCGSVAAAASAIMGGTSQRRDSTGRVPISSAGATDVTTSSVLTEPWNGSGLRPSSAAEKILLAKGLATVYDPNEDNQAADGSHYSPAAAADCERQAAMVRPGASNSGKTLLLQAVPAARLDMSDMAAFLTRPAPRTGAVLCFIEREKSGMGKSPCYRMHLDDGRTFLLAGRKRKKTTSSTYVISSSPDDLSRSSPGYLGKLRSNFVGTGFTIACKASSSNLAGFGVKGGLMACSSSSPNNKQCSGDGRGSTRSTRDSIEGGSGSGSAAVDVTMSDFGAVLYQYNVLGTRGPRRMSVAVPVVTGPEGCTRWRPAGPGDTLLDRLKSGATPSDQITVLKNKTPRWNEALNAYCLNFSGRVTEASVKNFQLATESDPDTVVLQFGKVSDACFTCDFMWPLSPLQAFCICLSSFDNKLACE